MVSPLKKLEERLEDHGRGQSGGLPYDPTRSEDDVMVSLQLDLIKPDPDQPRKDLGELNSLVESIQQHGLIQPIVVSRDEDGSFRIIAGERRFTAFQQMGRTEIPAVVRSREEHNRLAVQLVENVERKDLDPFEIAQCYTRIMRDLHLDAVGLAKYLKLSVTTIRETLSLNNLPDEIRNDVSRTSDVSRSLLVELAKVPGESRQLELWKEAKQGALTVRRLRSERSGKDKAPRKPAIKGSCRVFRVDDATVTVQFASAEATEAEVAQVLHQALRELHAPEPAEPTPW